MPQKRGGSPKRGAYQPVIFDGGERRKKKAGGRQQVQVVVVEGRDQVPHLTSTTPSASGPRRKKVGARNKESWVGQSPVVVSKLAWKYRWQLAPVVGWLSVFASTVHSAAQSLAVLLVVGAVAYALAHKELTFKKRKFISKQERLLVAYWCAGAAVAVVVELLTSTWDWRRATFVLTVATGWQTWRWWGGRRPTAAKGKLSKEAARYLSLWSRVSKYSEGTLKGSTVVAGTATEPTAGTLVFTAQLRADVHGRSAESEVVWRKVEALLALPPDTVRLKCDKKDATRIQVTMSASKHLETHVVNWHAPELTPDGGVLLGDDLAGVTVVVPRYDDKGVKHARISGNTGNGKTTTARVFLTACASATVSGTSPTDVPDLPDYGMPSARHEETIWLLDGKRGTSLPEVRNLFDWYAVTDDEWSDVLDAFYAVLLARQLRRGKAGQSAWRSGTEADPLLRLYIAESSAVRRSLVNRGLGKKYDRLVLECLQHGRALGVAVDQEAQDSVAENWLGGRPARELMSKGAAIMHRPGGATGQQFAADGATERMKLLKLPDAEGFAAVVLNGKPAADVMRVRWASEEATKEWAATYLPRTLEGADAAAAGPAYAKRTRGREDLSEGVSDDVEPVAADGTPVQSSDAPLPARAPARVERPSDAQLDWTGPDEDAGEPATEQELSNSRKWVLLTLQWNRNGLTAAELIERAEGKRGLGRSSIFGHLAWLKDNDLIGQDGDTYFTSRKD
jgi:hypothetical protein